MSNKFEQPTYEGPESLRQAITVDDPEVLARMIIGAALYEEDFDFVYRICVELSTHTHEEVRGNAILSFGHLARLFERTGDEAPSIVRRALLDPSDYVRGQAHAAADDLEQFLGISIHDASP